MTVLVTNVESQATLPGSVEVEVQAVVVEEEDSVEGEGPPEVGHIIRSSSRNRAINDKIP